MTIFIWRQQKNTIGNKFEEKIDFIFINENEVSLHLVATIGGKLFEDVVVIFKKQSVPGDKTSTETENDVARVKSNIVKEINASNDCKVFPNPAKNQISFQLSADISVQDLRLSIFNAAGQAIKNDLLQTTITNVSLKTYKTGIYFYKIMNKGQILYTGKFIIQ